MISVVRVGDKSVFFTQTAHLKPGAGAGEAHDRGAGGLGLPAEGGVGAVLAVRGHLARRELRQQRHVARQPRHAARRLRHHHQWPSMPLPTTRQARTMLQTAVILWQKLVGLEKTPAASNALWGTDAGDFQAHPAET